MKKIVTIILTMTLILACSVCFAESAVDEFASHIRPLCGIVIEVNYGENYIAIEDFTGNVWEWEGAEDWQEGDIAAMIMDDNGTESIFDDIILDIQYCGTLEG
jgi:hypothetical protein